MNRVVKELAIDVAKKNKLPKIKAKQYDNKTRFIKATITNEGEKLTIGSAKTVTINALREDNVSKSFEGAVNEDGTVLVPITYWMLEIEGMVECDISIIGTDEEILTTTVFYIDVETASRSNDDIAEDENYDILLSLIKNATNIKKEEVASSVKEWLDEHPEATTTVQDESITLAKLNSDVKNFIRGGNINVMDFGAVGDGVTDDREAIENAVASLADDGVLVFPKGHYMIKSFPEGFVGTTYFNSTIFGITNKKNVVIDLNGSTIEVCENGYVRYCLFRFNDCENFAIKNGILKGDRMAHDYTTVNSTHEWGCGVLVGSSKYSSRTDATNSEEFAEPTANKCYGQIVNLEIYDFTGDGITINNGLAPGKVEVVDCNIHHCRRQGITIGDSDVVVVNRCHIHHIGTFDNIVGASPQSGIDIEAEMGTYHVSSVDIQNTLIEDTCGYNIVCSPSRILNSDDTLKGAKYIVDEIFINACTLNGVSIFSGWKSRTYNGVAIEYTPTTITNSIITHGKYYILNDTNTDIVSKYNGIAFNNTQIFNSIINSSKEDIYADNTDFTIYTCEATETVLIENCVINLFHNNARLRNGQLTNTIVNGGSIFSFEQASNNATIKDCTNVNFNGCLFAITGAKKRFKFALCRFNNCGLVKDDTGTLALRNCYLDSRIFKNASYVNCTIEDEIEVKITSENNGQSETVKNVNEKVGE